MIRRLDFVGVPSRDSERSRTFYVDTLGLTPDANARYEVWVGQTCLGIWEPEQFGFPFQPQKNAHLALQVDDVDLLLLRQGTVEVGGEQPPLHEQHLTEAPLGRDVFGERLVQLLMGDDPMIHEDLAEILLRVRRLQGRLRSGCHHPVHRRFGAVVTGFRRESSLDSNKR